MWIWDIHFGTEWAREGMRNGKSIKAFICKHFSSFLTYWSKQVMRPELAPVFKQKMIKNLCKTLVWNYSSTLRNSNNMLRINRPRPLSKLSNIIRTLCTTNISATPSKKPLDLSPSATQINDQNPSVPPTNPTANKPSNLLKFGLLGSLAGALVAAGYATYGTLKISWIFLILGHVIMLMNVFGISVCCVLAILKNPFWYSSRHWRSDTVALYWGQF